MGDMKSLLVADIGNTHIHFGVVKGKRIAREFKVKTASVEREYLKELFTDFSNVSVCSVVPHVSDLFKGAALAVGIDILFAGEELVIPIKNKYNDPEAVGKDRLVNCYAALKVDEKVRLVIDFGTALTFDFISEERAYLGGAIVPGMGLALQSLSAQCALLPKHVSLGNRKVSCIGKTTDESIASGIFWGYTGICNWYIETYRKLLKKPFNVCVTGGDSALMKPYLRHKNMFYEPLLVLKGLVSLLQKKGVQ